MEIRRKVFSLLQDENGEERYYSTNEFEMSFDEETGEKLFSEKEDKGMSKGAKAALGAGGAVAATAAGLEGAYLLGNKLAKDNRGIDIINQTKAAKRALKAQLDNHEINMAEYEKGIAKLEKTAERRKSLGKLGRQTSKKLGFVGEVNEFVSGKAGKVSEKASEVKEKISEKANEAKEKISEKANEAKEKISEKASEAKGKISEKASELKGKAGASAKKYSGKLRKFAGTRAGKAVILTGTGLTAAGAGLYGGYKMGKNSK